MAMEREPDKEGLAHKAISGLRWELVGSFIRFVARLGIGITLARLLLPEDFGIVGAAFLVTGFASTMRDLGFGQALIQRKTVSGRHVRVCQTFSVAVSALLTALVYSSAVSVANVFGDTRVGPVVQVVAFTLLFSGFGSTSHALLRRRLAFRTTVRISLVSNILGYGTVAVPLAMLGFGYWSLVGGSLAENLSSSLLTYSAERHSLKPLIARTEIRDLVGVSVGMSLDSTANYFALQGDKFVVGRLLSLTSLGFYSRAYALMELPLALIGSAASRVLFPAMAQVQDDRERFRRVYLTVFSLSVAVALLVSVAILILAPEIVLTLYGERWAPTVPLVQILGFFGMFRMSYNTAATIVKARGQVYRLFLSQILYGLCVVAGGWWAATTVGLEGVAWAVGGAITGMWLLNVRLANVAAGVSTAECARTIATAMVPGLTVGLALFIVVAGLRVVGVPRVAILGISGIVFGIGSGWSLFYLSHRFNHPALSALSARVLSAGTLIRSRLASLRFEGTAP